MSSLWRWMTTCERRDCPWCRVNKTLWLILGVVGLLVLALAALLAALKWAGVVP